MLLLNEFVTKLEYHETLNPQLFDGNNLKSNIKDKLLQIARLFADDCNLDESLIIDYYLVGGNANFNYTNNSDIDVHLIVDFSKIDSGIIDLADYFKSKKELWSDNHTLTICGYPVEFFVQDTNQRIPHNQGCYSLLKNKFIILPKKVKVDYNDPKLISNVESFIKKINYADNLLQLSTLKNKLKDMRSSGLSKGGEYSWENLLFKSLRNLGYIDLLLRKYKTLRDKELSYD